MKHYLLVIFIFIFVLFFSTGCTKVGPNYVKQSKYKLPESWDGNTSLKDESTKDWWKLFNDDILDTLVKKTYEQNLDLRSAGLRILQARATLGISNGLQYPQVQTLSGSIVGGRSGSNNFVSAGVNFDMAWEMDVWGQYARGIEASEASLYASLASYDEILVSIISEVARNYINYRTAEERIAFAKRNIKTQTRVTKMTEIQFNAGNVSELDIQQARTQLYTTKSLLPSLELSMIKSKNAIAILLGVMPMEIEILLAKDTKTKNKSYEQYDKITIVPTAKLADDFKIDADLVRRRPDLQVAEYLAQANSARIGMAEAELYPHFSLFGSLGFNTSNSGSNWISAGDAVGISAGPSFSWNIFAYDRIKNQVRVQDAVFQESLLNYNKKVLIAVGEVSNSLNAYKLTHEQLRLNEKTIEATLRAFELSMTQYEHGLVTYQRLLSTVENLTKSEDQYAQIKGSIALQVIALYKALGGGWELRANKAYINDEDKEQMKNRTDWGEYLDDK